MAFSPAGSIGPSPKPIPHSKGKPPQRGPQEPSRRPASSGMGRGGSPEEKVKGLSSSYEQATAMWSGYKKATEAMIKAKGTPDYTELSAAREASLKEIHSRVSPRVAQFGKAWGVAALGAASGNRQMQKQAAEMDNMIGSYLSRAANLMESKRLAAGNAVPKKGRDSGYAQRQQEQATRELHSRQRRAKIQATRAAQQGES